VIAWSPDGNYIATGDQDATVHFWMVRTGKDLQMYGYPTKVRELGWHRSSRYLATGGSNTVTVWDCSGKGPAGTKPIELKGHATLVTSLAFQQRGPILAAGSDNGSVLFWNILRPKRPLGQTACDASISHLTWSPDDTLIAFGTAAGLVTVCTPPQT
jgi:WD40 repeat protein